MNRTCDWASVRSRYVVGDESLAAIALEIGVSKRAVQLHASDRRANAGQTWVEMRSAFRRGIADDAEQITVKLRTVAAATVAMQHAAVIGMLAEVAGGLVEDAYRRCEPKDQVRFFLEIVSLERKIHGLDRVQVEVSGKDGEPIAYDIAIDQETRALAEHALQAIFGGRAQDAQQQVTPRLHAVA
jgi:hypothetical protein